MCETKNFHKCVINGTNGTALRSLSESVRELAERLHKHTKNPHSGVFVEQVKQAGIIVTFTIQPPLNLACEMEQIDLEKTFRVNNGKNRNKKGRFQKQETCRRKVKAFIIPRELEPLLIPI